MKKLVAIVDPLLLIIAAVILSILFGSEYILVVVGIGIFWQLNLIYVAYKKKNGL